jgi:hypothetical protein
MSEEEGWQVQTYKHPKPAKRPITSRDTKVQNTTRVRDPSTKSNITSEKAEAKLIELHMRGVIKKEIERIKNFK